MRMRTVMLSTDNQQIHRYGKQLELISYKNNKRVCRIT